MKSVRVMVEFIEVNEQGDLLDSKKFGSVSWSDVSPSDVPSIAQSLSDTVENTVLYHFPDFLKESA